MHEQQYDDESSDELPDEDDVFPLTSYETKDSCASIPSIATIQEYDYQIQKLEQINATLRENISALYAEANEQRDGPKQQRGAMHMEITQDEAYETSIVPYKEPGEEECMLQIDRLEKLNARLRWKLVRQKMLVSQLSANLHVASEKIDVLTRLGSGTDVILEESTSYKPNEVEYIHGELQSILHLMRQNSVEHRESTTELLEVDVARNRSQSKDETVSDKVQRVIRLIRDEQQQLLEKDEKKITFDSQQDNPASTEQPNVISDDPDKTKVNHEEGSSEKNQSVHEASKEPLIDSCQAIDELETSSAKASDIKYNSAGEADNDAVVADNVVDLDAGTDDSIVLRKEPHENTVQPAGKDRLDDQKRQSLHSLSSTSSSSIDLMRKDKGNTGEKSFSEEILLVQDSKSAEKVDVDAIGEFVDTNKYTLVSPEDIPHAPNQVTSEMESSSATRDKVDIDASSSLVESYCMQPKSTSQYQPESTLDGKNIGQETVESEVIDAPVQEGQSLFVHDEQKMDPKHGRSERNSLFDYSISDLVPSKASIHEVSRNAQPLEMATSDEPVQHHATEDQNDSNFSSPPCDVKTNLHDPQINALSSSMNSLSMDSLKAWDEFTMRTRKNILRGEQSNDPLSVRLNRRQLYQCQNVLPIEIKERKQLCVLVRAENRIDFVPPLFPPPLSPDNQSAPVFKKGLPDGFYRYKSSSGNKYTGHWKHGKRHGFGTATYREGETYCGHWNRGKRHGLGTVYLANKEVFHGSWIANKKNGIGSYFWVDGDVDVSLYDNDVRLVSIRWSKDRRTSHFLDLKLSKKHEISLELSAKIVRKWETDQLRAAVTETKC